MKYLSTKLMLSFVLLPWVIYPFTLPLFPSIDSKYLPSIITFVYQPIYLGNTYS